MNLESNKQNQEIKSNGHGGKRAGAGRKSMRGEEEVSRKMRRKFNDYVNEEQMISIINSALEKAEKGDVKMQKFLMEQWFGKATQRQEISGDEGGPVMITGFNYITPQNAITIDPDDSNNLPST